MSHQLVKVPIKERYTLTTASSTKETYHIVLDLKGLNIEYKVGDCVAIYPQNDDEHVQKIILALQATGTEKIFDTRKKQIVELKAFLKTQADLFRIKKKLLSLLGLSPTSEIGLISLLEKNAPVNVELQTFCENLFPLLPRFYSIASSMQEVGAEAHLTVAVTGLCTQFLCKRVELQKRLITLYHHPTKDFTLSESSFSAPIIMIGPGTGIAPFVGFLQERIRKGAKKNWLFFGERNKKNDFYYQNYLESLQKKGWLQLETAFSRDQEHKVYVQHKMRENSHTIWLWLQEGAHLYVCGDAKRMAKAVDQTLHAIIAKEGHFDPASTKKYVRDLRLQKRYLCDVY